jgi:hypothetical protein
LFFVFSDQTIFHNDERIRFLIIFGCWAEHTRSAKPASSSRLWKFTWRRTHFHTSRGSRLFSFVLIVTLYKYSSPLCSIGLFTVRSSSLLLLLLLLQQKEDKKKMC